MLLPHRLLAVTICVLISSFSSTFVHGARTINELQVGDIRMVMDLKGFTKSVLGLSFSSDGTMLAACGQAEVRLWDVRSGRLLRVLRGEIGKEGYGDCTAVAFSADNCELVVGIRSKDGRGALRVYDIRNISEMKELVEGFPGTVEQLAFSRDGRHLVAACSGGHFLVYDWRVRRLVASSQTAPNAAQNVARKLIRFPTAGSLLLSFSRERTTVLSVPALSPVTLDQRVPSALLRWIDLHQRVSLPHQGQLLTLDLRLDRDKWLAAGIAQQDSTVRHWVACWTGAAVAPDVTYDKHRRPITAVAISGAGTLAASADAQGEVHVWDSTTGQMRFRFSSVGFSIGRATFDLERHCIGFTTEPVSDQTGHRSHEGAIDRVFDLDRGAIRPVAQGEFSSEGANRPSPFRVTSSIDRTIRLWNLESDVEPVLSILIVDEDDWIMWTPQGYYDASPGCGALVGWHVNQGADQVAAYYPLHQFRDQLYRPDLVRLVLQQANVDAAIATASDPDYAIAQPISSPVPLTTDLRKPRTMQQLQPPRVRLLSPLDGMVTRDGQVHLLAEIVSDNQLPVADVRVLINGRPAMGKGVSIVGGDGVSAGRASFSRAVKLLPGENEISVMASNGIAASVPVTVRVTYQAPEKVVNARPNLHLLSIGISDYKDESLSLRFAHLDAQAFAKAWECQQGPVFESIQTTVLVNHEATVPRIQQAMQQLSERVSQRDMAVIFISAHGIRDRQLEYYLATHEIDPEDLKNTGLHFSAMSQLLETLPCKVLLFVDTCHAAGITGAKAIYRDPLYELTSDEYGAIVFTSSLAREISIENEQWQHGAFTKAILDTFATPESDMNRDGFLSLTEMEQSVSDRVRTMTDGAQHPVMKRPATIHNIPFFYLGQETDRGGVDQPKLAGQ